MGRERRVIEPIVGGLLIEARNAILVGALVDVELVAPIRGTELSSVADVDVEETVPVEIHHGDAGRPALVIADARLVGDILELQVVLVQVQSIRAHIGGEVQVRPPVIVHVSHAHTASVVEVLICKQVSAGLVLDLVDERNSR